MWPLRGPLTPFPAIRIHYRNYPAVLVRLAETRAPMLRDVLGSSWEHVAALPPRRAQRRKAARRRR